MRLRPDGKTVFIEIDDMKPGMRGTVYHAIHALAYP